MANTPIVNLGQRYIDAGGLGYISATQVVVGSGAARSVGNLWDIEAPTGVVLDTGKTGVNGIDVGTVQPNQFYGVHLIADTTRHQPTAAILTASILSPVLPAGYDVFRRMGNVLTNGSSEIRVFYDYGSARDKVMYYEEPISVLSGGNATTFTPVPVAAALPPTFVEVFCDVTYTPNSATNIAEFLPSGSGATTGMVRFGTGVAAQQVGEVRIPTVPAGGGGIVYKVANAADILDLKVIGYRDSL